jgi:DNA polymerase-3 subunit alpha
MSDPKYFALHTHSTYSFRDGYGKPEQHAKRLQEIGQCGCALTDHGNVFGHIHFFNAFKKAGLHPVLGCEFYHCEDIKTPGKNSDAAKQGEAKVKANHLTVIAQSQVGYRNLLKLTEISNRVGFHGVPHIDFETLARYQEGLVVLSGCMGGRISQHIIKGKEDRAFAMVEWAVQNIEQFYIEILPCEGIPDSQWACSNLWTMSQELGIPAVVTDDAHFPSPEDATHQEAMLCSNYKQKLRSEDRKYRIAPYHYQHNGAMIMARAELVLPHIPKEDLFAAIERSAEIAQNCQVELERCQGPQVTVPIGFTPYDYLVRKVEEGKQYRRGLGLVPEEGTPEWDIYEKRAAYEMDIIRHHKFEDYFLLVADIVEWSLKNRYWCIARGSAGGSLVCWYLQISQIDPIKWKLPVERFIDYSRTDMPDIDLDFDSRHREKVFVYLKEKYGDEHCAQIAALSTYRARASLDAIGDVCDISPAVINAAKRLLPELDDEGEGIKATGHLHRLFTEHPEARKLVIQTPDLWLAAGIEGQIKTHSIHAAGFVVDRAVLSDVVGIIERPKHPRIIACDKDLAAEQGMLKIDALSVEMLSAIAEVLDSMGEWVDWLYRVPLDDRPTYDLLCSGRNMGIFQMKGHTTGRLLLKLQPSEFNDLIALAALGRPGPLQSGGTEDYIKRKHGRERLPDFHDAIMEVLLDTYGVVIYQEQVMEIAMKVGGLSVGDAHKIRKLIAKSGGSAVLEKYYEPFMDGARSQNVPDDQAERVWEMCQEAGDYVFNKAHGAAYAQIGYWTAYLKTHHNTQFTISCANHEKKDGFQRQLLREYRQHGGTLKLLDPNESKDQFSSPYEGLIVGGFRNIRGVGSVSADSLSAGKPYRDWLDFYRRCPKMLREALQATRIHEEEMDLDVALAIAPWFVEVTYGAFEHAAMKKNGCETVADVLFRFENKKGSRNAKIVARITDVALSNTKKGKPGATTGKGESITLSLTDPTASVDARFAGWKWRDIMQLRNPLVGNTEGKGNLVLVYLLFSDDWSRIYGENIFLIRESKGYLSENVRKALAADARGDKPAQANLFDDYVTPYQAGI